MLVPEEQQVDSEPLGVTFWGWLFRQFSAHLIDQKTDVFQAREPGMRFPLFQFQIFTADLTYSFKFEEA